MSRPTIRWIVPESPIYVRALEAETGFVGLGKPSESPDYHVFIQLSPPGASPAQGDVVHIIPAISGGIGRRER